MTDIDYSKFSYREYKKGESGIRSKKGRIRYNFVNYEEYRKYNGENNDVKEEVKAEENAVKENENREEIKEDKKENPESDEESHIEDLRSKKKSRAEKEPMDKSRLKRDVIAVMMVVICFALTIVSADILSGGEIFDKLGEAFISSSGVPVYYAVEVGSYADVESKRGC
jgi:hypothetical protein